LQRKQKNPENKFGFIDIRNCIITPIKGVLLDSKNVDFFVTASDKEILEPQMRDIVTESLGKEHKLLPLDKKIKLLLENLSKMRENLSHGKPIEGLNKFVTTTYLRDSLDLSKAKTLKAEDAFEGIKKGNFDIVEGALAFLPFKS
jgi:hypothetical protein